MNLIRKIDVSVFVNAMAAETAFLAVAGAWFTRIGPPTNKVSSIDVFCHPCKDQVIWRFFPFLDANYAVY